MAHLIGLELKKLAKPVLVTLIGLTMLTCILSCTLYREYSVFFDIDAWEIGTEFLGLLFPLFVTIPVCWELYYERRNRFLVYTLPRVGKRAYLGAKWWACALSAFFILFIPFFFSALCALFLTGPKDFMPVGEGYHHIFHTLYTQTPLLYAFLLSLWKGVIGVLVMGLGFALSLYSGNIFVILTGPFVYAILENFILAILDLPEFRLVTAFEPTSLSATIVNAGSFLVGPLLLCCVTALVVLFFQKGKHRAVYPI